MTDFVGRFGRVLSLPPSLPTTDEPGQIATRLRMMDDAKVRKQFLSPFPLPCIAGEADSAEAARLVNDTQAELIGRYPDRFAGYVSLPLPHVEAALRELARGLDDLGMAGVTMQCSIGNRSVAEPEFEPIYRELDARRAVLFLHPSVNGICSPMINDYRFAPSVGTSMEDTVVVLHLIARRIPNRYPNIKIIVPHLGGLLPMLLNRLDYQVPADHPDLPEAPSATARRFWYDTVAHSSKAALRCACEAFGASRLVPGSDFPTLAAHEHPSAAFTYIRESGLPDDAVEAILHRNAPALFGFSD
jgi:predicted TIM-barrel fold metal-dependent hydrolase